MLVELKNCFYISPETFVVTYDYTVVSAPQSNNPLHRVKGTPNSLGFRRNDVGIHFAFQPDGNLLADFSTISQKSVAFPIVSAGAQTLVLPIMGQGKAIPTAYKTCLKYLVNNFVFG
ncbi:hypothetical protein [Coxiella endosymbiont of Ornithodoros maritimus]|uniref:hypothetical protein n=1 Tax=Coxiella endosymbiont of Ornithodoros maritimus TaxID=1656172 RepID=UPI0022652ADA|nr:hypothetical protein [Coxiella endosymbiont of Ornithodoros maritimus]